MILFAHVNDSCHKYYFGHGIYCLFIFETVKPVTASAYLSSHHKHQLKQLTKDLKLVKSGFERGDIHRLRVDIKKLRALYRLMELLYPKQYEAKEHMPPLKKVFKHAGEIREMQVNLDYIKQYKLPAGIVKPYIAFLKEHGKEARHRLKRNIKHYKEDGGTLTKTELSALYKQLSILNIEHILYDETKSIQNLVHDKLTVNRLHEIRKRLKSLAEVIKLVTCINPGFLPEALPAVLKQTETLIGQWHDRIVLIQSLNSYMAECKLPDTDITAIKKVISAIRLRNKTQLELLKHKLGITLSMCA